MPAGLQIWDATGHLIVDTTSKLARIIGSVAIGAGNQTSSVTDSHLSEGTPFFFLAYNGLTPLVVSIAGTTISWAPAVGFVGTFTGTLYYGVHS